MSRIYIDRNKHSSRTSMVRYLMVKEEPLLQVVTGK